MPPPGAPPLTCEISAPGIFPWIEFSTVGVGTWFSASALTTDTALAAFCECDSSGDASEQYTCETRRNTSFCRTTVYVIFSSSSKRDGLREVTDSAYSRGLSRLAEFAG